MIAFLTLLYSALVWLIFIKLKLLPWNRGSQFGVVAVGISSIIALLVAMGLYQPYSTDVRVYNFVVEIVPRVTGRVIDVPVEGGAPVEKGAVLFRVDPRPFEYEVNRLRADLIEARANRELTKAEYERNQQAKRTGAVSQSEVDAAQARYEAGRIGRQPGGAARPGRVGRGGSDRVCAVERRRDEPDAAPRPGRQHNGRPAAHDLREH